MPKIVLDYCDMGPPDLPDQMPLRGELVRTLAGSDRSDYCLVRLQRAIGFTPPEWFDLSTVSPELIGRMLGFDGELVRVPALIVGARMVGTQISPTSNRLLVNLAYIIDPTQIWDDRLHLEKCYFAAIAALTIVEP